MITKLFLSPLIFSPLSYFMRFVFLSSLSFFPSFFLSFLFPFFPSFLSSSMYSFSFSIHYSLRQILLRPLINPNANTQLVEFSRGSSSFPDRKVTWILFGQHGNVRESSSIGSRPFTKVRSLSLSLFLSLTPTLTAMPVVPMYNQSRIFA